MREVEGKVAVVTGAASGIGRGMAEAFLDAGMKVVLSDVEEPALAATVRALRDSGGDVHGVPADVAKRVQVERLAKETLTKYGAVHVLCNNAGISLESGAASWESTPDDWAWILGVNLHGVIHGQCAFLPIMLEQNVECHVVNTASLAGLLTGSDTLYGMTKAAVVRLTEGTYLELQNRRSKIGMSVVCPGYVDTHIMQAARNRPGELGDAAPGTESRFRTLFIEWVEEQLKSGLSPRSVGDITLAAIRERRFYVLTHPEWTPLIAQRCERLVSGQNPEEGRPPGIETFLERLAGSTVRTS
jgi:NAD(P)-dependent dehydrogenase (short-subunit alcohol dehydrogenase family)